MEKRAFTLRHGQKNKIKKIPCFLQSPDNIKKHSFAAEVMVPALSEPDETGDDDDDEGQRFGHGEEVDHAHHVPDLGPML
jgi:hypothetical protein